jgi:hypothetical protein
MSIGPRTQVRNGQQRVIGLRYRLRGEAGQRIESTSGLPTRAFPLGQANHMSNTEILKASQRVVDLLGLLA